MSVPGIPEFPELELLGHCQIMSELPLLSLDRGDGAGFTGQPQQDVLEPFVQEGEGGQHGSGGVGLHLPSSLDGLGDDPGRLALDQWPLCHTLSVGLLSVAMCYGHKAQRKSWLTTPFSVAAIGFLVGLKEGWSGNWKSP